MILFMIQMLLLHGQASDLPYGVLKRLGFRI